MSKITIQVNENFSKEYRKNIVAREVLEDVDVIRKKDMIAVRIDGIAKDLNTEINQDCKLSFITFEDEEGKKIYNHSTSHILAQAVRSLYKNVKLGIGPAIKDGFYYDFDFKHSIEDGDLLKIENYMQEIIKKELPFERMLMSKKEAIDFFNKQEDSYKMELIEEIEGEEISFYKQGNFVDFCRGPHVPNTGYIKAFKLTSLAGAYWRGDEKKAMLTRIYGSAFDSQEKLKKYLDKIEEAKRRDHRKLGKELEIFNIYENAGAGLIYYHPYGSTLRQEICQLLRDEHKKRGYLEVVTPHIAKIDLWNRSGHSEFYRENMYFLEIDNDQYVLKPMNCPGHILIYKSKTRSYRELPIKYFELGTVYRYERSGVLHGLLRVRGFTQDDAHIFCMPEQLNEEINKIIDFAFYMLNIFGFKEFEIYLSTRPDKFVGTIENWEKATNALKNSLESRNLSYKIDEGEGVFYGPKIDVKLKDALGRAWQGPTIQVDFNLPNRFEVDYIDSNGKECMPIMIHRVVLGSLERFIGALIEHYGGVLPLWLSPVQVKIATIAERHIGFAKEIEVELEKNAIRFERDYRNEKIGLKVREAQIYKVPYMLIIGDKEIKENMISVRNCRKNDTETMSHEQFLEKILKEAKEKSK
ncbi:MAG: threonine--tRNA ligase [bacterium]|nr:threonine--tRNA ligase [bacterium]